MRIRHKKDAEINPEKDYHLMVDYLRLHVMFATSSMVAELQLTKFSIGYLYDATVARDDSYLANLMQIP